MEDNKSKFNYNSGIDFETVEDPADLEEMIAVFRDQMNGKDRKREKRVSKIVNLIFLYLFFVGSFITAGWVYEGAKKVISWV